jgi:peptidoglycan/LPS O-acetylase OafA/YrhL
MLHAFKGLNDPLTWNYPSWSIGAEFYTYLAFAALAAICVIRLLPCAIVSGVGFLAILFFAPALMSTMDAPLVPRCLYGFFVGAFVWRLSSPVTISAEWATSLEIALVGVIGLLIVYASHTRWELVIPLLFGAVVLIFSKQGGWLSRLMGSRPMSALGAWSYSIYMVHAFIGVLFYDVVTTVGSKFHIHVFDDRGLSIGAYTDALTFAYICIVIAVSAISYRIIELPGQRLIPQRVNRLILTDVWRRSRPSEIHVMSPQQIDDRNGAKLAPSSPHI